MKRGFLDRAGSEEGSSTVLVIISVIAVAVMIALMARLIGLGDGEEAEANQDAIAETLGVFKNYESVMDGESKGGGAGSTDKEASTEEATNRTRTAPMHFTDPASRKEIEAKGGSGAEPTKVKLKTSSIEPDKVDASLNLDGDGAEPKKTADLAENIGPISEGSSGEGSAKAQLEPLKGSFENLYALEMASGNAAIARVTSEEVLAGELTIAAVPADPVNQLSAPLFSLAGGKFPITDFGLKLKLADPNPKDVSRILYSMDEGPWKRYTGVEITVPPGTTVRAICESIHPDWKNSEGQMREYAVDFLELKSPRIGASAPGFDEQTNRSVMVSMINPNSLTKSRIEYRINRAEWRAYERPIKLAAKKYAKSGVRVEARVVGLRRSPEVEQSGVATFEIGRPVLNEGEVAGEERELIDPNAVDLESPVFAHGYSERQNVYFRGTGESLLERGGRFVIGAPEADGERMRNASGVRSMRIENGSSGGNAETWKGAAKGMGPELAEAVSANHGGQAFVIDLFPSVALGEIRGEASSMALGGF